ncbi:MAG TPA: hypothetical protein VFI73_07455 [Candidatus Nitrosopolaris sp.]|nr:hypothetical protein [Candidatus Nitrosopolaris sp.]
MKLVEQEVLILSILMMLVTSYCSTALSMQLAAASSSRSSGTQFSVVLVRSNTQNGPVNISVNDTVVASNIDAAKKNSLVIPITIPSKITSGPMRICVTAVTPPAAQICTDVQNTKQGGKNKVTLDLTRAIAG